MEWSKILRITRTVGELARLLPDDSPCRVAVGEARLYWKELLSLVDQEMSQQENWGEGEGLYWEQLHDLRGELQALVEIWISLTSNGAAVVPLSSQGLLDRVLNLRWKRNFDVENNLKREQVTFPAPYSYKEKT